MDFPNRLYELRMASRTSQKELGVYLNISQSEYSRLEKGSRRLGKHLEPLKKYFSDKLQRDIKSDDIYNESTVSDPNQYNFNRLVDFPVFGRGQLDGGIIFEEAIEMIERPSGMALIKDGYACKVVGSEMQPRLYAGNLLIIDPTSIPMQGQICIVSFSDNVKARYIREFVSLDNINKKITLKQLNPEEETVYDSGDVNVLHTVRGVRFF